MGRKRKEWRIDWECTTNKIPQPMKKTLIEMIGKEETGKLIRAIRHHKFIMLVGPEHSGKSAIRKALVAIGYPWVIEDNGPGLLSNEKTRKMEHTSIAMEEVQQKTRYCIYSKWFATSPVC